MKTKQPLWPECLRLFFVTIIAFLFSSSLAFSDAANSTRASCKNPSSSLLWSVNGGKSTVYLFGSIHIGAKNFYPLDEKIENIFRAADHLVFEVDPNNITDPAIAIEIESRRLIPNNGHLEDFVSKPIVDDVKKALTDFGLPAESFMVFRPWFITLLLTNMQMTSMGYMQSQGVEQYLLREKTDTTEVLELETMRSQLDLLEELDGEAFLAYTLANLTEGRAAVKKLIEAWRCSDKDELTSLFSSEFNIVGPMAKKMEALEEKLLFIRNENMAEKIGDYLKNGKGSYFVVVGTAHYLGEKSIIKKLEERGYSVLPITL